MDTITTKPILIRSWVGATFGGWVLGVVLIIVLSSGLDSIGIENMQFYLGIGMGAGVGLAQWLYLKKWVGMSPNWIWFSALGLGLPFVALDLLVSGTASYKIPLSVVFGAPIVGLLQQTLLRRYWPVKTYRWVGATLLAWPLAVLTVFIVDYTRQLDQWIPNVLVIAFINLVLILAGGLVLGGITGFVLKKMGES